MSRFAAMAEDYWRRYLPLAYGSLKDRRKFFDDLGQEAQDQVDDLAEQLRADNSAEEPFAARMARYAQARATAEEVVIHEVLLARPEVSTEAANSEAETVFGEITIAMNEFQALREQMLDK